MLSTYERESIVKNHCSTDIFSVDCHIVERMAFLIVQGGKTVREQPSLRCIPLYCYYEENLKRRKDDKTECENNKIHIF